MTFSPTPLSSDHHSKELLFASSPQTLTSACTFSATVTTQLDRLSSEQGLDTYLDVFLFLLEANAGSDGVQMGLLIPQNAELDLNISANQVKSLELSR